MITFARVFRLYVHTFLDLPDTVHALSTERALREDSLLIEQLLGSYTSSHHFFQRCSLDWFHECAEFCADTSAQWSGCQRVHGRRLSTSHPPLILSDGDTQRPLIQLLHVIGLVNKLLLPWCFQPFPVNDDVHVLRPVVIPLVRAPRGSANAEKPSRLESPTTSSALGVHWDNIECSPSRVRCACCEAFETTLREYRQTVELLYRRWVASAVSHRELWRTLGYSARHIDRLTTRLHHVLFPADGFFNQDMAMASDLDLMEYVCTNSDMSCAFSAARGRLEPSQVRLSCSWKAVFDPAMRRMCRDFLQPFRVQAPLYLANVDRGLHAPSPHGLWDAMAKPTIANSPSVEFVGGVAPSGLLVGFYSITRPKLLDT